LDAWIGARAQQGVDRGQRVVPAGQVQWRLATLVRCVEWVKRRKMLQLRVEASLEWRTQTYVHEGAGSDGAAVDGCGTAWAGGAGSVDDACRGVGPGRGRGTARRGRRRPRAGGGGLRIDQQVERDIANEVGSGGEALEPETRIVMEARFGHDFGAVRVHADRDASESAHGLGALAYTAGRHIVFGEGQYAPRSATGQQLLAHEVTHVMQQSRAPMSGPGPGVAAQADDNTRAAQRAPRRPAVA
jgi:hypothetical protein